LNLNQDASLRVLLVGRVVVGKTLKKRKNEKTLTGVPPPYHSLVGEAGDHLNYEETVVFNNDAIHPVYLIVYGNAPSTGTTSQSWISRLFHIPLA